MSTLFSNFSINHFVIGLILFFPMLFFLDNLIHLYESFISKEEVKIKENHKYIDYKIPKHPSVILLAISVVSLLSAGMLNQIIDTILYSIFQVFVIGICVFTICSKKNNVTFVKGTIIGVSIVEAFALFVAILV